MKLLVAICVAILLLMAGHTICRIMEVIVEDSRSMETRDMANAMRSLSDENRELKHRLGM